MHIKSSYVTLTAAQKVTAAQNFWSARKPIGDQALNHIVTPDMPTSWSIQPPQVNWSQTAVQQKDPAMDQLADAMSKMTAHVAKLTEMMQGGGPAPIRRSQLMVQNQPRRRPCQHCGNDHMDYECPTPIR